MRPLYKTTFQIVPLDDKSHGDLADEVMGSVTGWVTSHYQRDGLPVPVASDVAEITRRRDDPLQVKDVQLESGEFHRALFWTHPASNGANYYWSTLCDLAFADERFDFQFVLGVESNDYSCVPGDLRPARPRLIADLLGNPHWRCVSGGVELPMFPRTLTVHEVDEFCTLLYAGNRTVPVVVMSPRLGPRRVYPVEPRLLAERLAGTARVAVLRDSLAHSVFNQYMGPNLSVADDAIRVMSPNLDPRDDPAVHWHFLGDTIRGKRLSQRDFADFLFGRLAERAVVSVSDPPALAAFRKLERERAGEYLDRLEQRLTTRAAEAEELYSAAQGQVDELTVRIGSLEVQLLEKDDYINALQHQLAAARTNIEDLSRSIGVGAVEHSEAAAKPVEGETVELIVRNAASCLTNLVFLNSAFKSATEVPESFEFPGRVRAHLEALNEASAARDPNGSLGTGWKEYFRHLGFDYKAKISDASRNQWADEYTFDYEGQAILFEEHFTIGARGANTCLSIHFSTRIWPDKIVVAHVGRHLTNTTT